MSKLIHDENVFELQEASSVRAVGDVVPHCIYTTIKREHSTLIGRKIKGRIGEKGHVNHRNFVKHPCHHLYANNFVNFMGTQFGGRLSERIIREFKLFRNYAPKFSEIFRRSAPEFVCFFTRKIVICSILHGAESFLRSQPVLQLIKKFPAFYGTRKFITVLTSA